MEDANQPIPHAIQDSEILYRRVVKKSNNFVSERHDLKTFKTARDFSVPELKAGTGAFSLTDEERKNKNEGVSVYIDSLMQANSIPCDSLCDDWDRWGVFCFRASAPRAGGGDVIAREDDKDPKRGKAHGLVVWERDKDDTANWKRIRLEIIKEARWWPEISWPRPID